LTTAGSSVILTNAIVAPTNACLGTSFSASVSQITSNGNQIVTTTYTNSGNSGSGACPDTYTTNAVSPTIISNWWVASVGSFSATGSGLSASFTPTNCGNGSIAFNTAWQNGCDTNNQTTSVSTNFTVKATNLSFDDAPTRPKNPAQYPITWSATLQAVCQSATVASDYTVLDSVTYGFTIGAGGVVTTTPPGGGSDIVIDSFSTIDTTTKGGVNILAHYTSHCNCTNTLQWVQTVTTSLPLGGATSPYNDPQPPDDDLPYYWTSSQNAANTSTCP
jgi:hypothetical protein